MSALPIIHRHIYQSPPSLRYNGLHFTNSSYIIKWPTTTATCALSTLYQNTNATPIPVDPRNTRAAQISTGTFALIYAMMLNDAKRMDSNHNG